MVKGVKMFPFVTPHTFRAPTLLFFLASTMVKRTYRRNAKDLGAYWITLWPWQEARLGVDFAELNQERSVAGATVAQIT